MHQVFQDLYFCYANIQNNSYWNYAFTTDVRVILDKPRAEGFDFALIKDLVDASVLPKFKTFVRSYNAITTQQKITFIDSQYVQAWKILSDLNLLNESTYEVIARVESAHINMVLENLKTLQHYPAMHNRDLVLFIFSQQYYCIEVLNKLMIDLCIKYVFTKENIPDYIGITGALFAVNMSDFLSQESFIYMSKEQQAAFVHTVNFFINCPFMVSYANHFIIKNIIEISRAIEVLSVENKFDSNAAEWLFSEDTGYKVRADIMVECDSSFIAIRQELLAKYTLPIQLLVTLHKRNLITDEILGFDRQSDQPTLRGLSAESRMHTSNGYRGQGALN